MDDVEECPDGLYTARLLLFDDTGTAAKDAMDHVQAGAPDIDTLQLLPLQTSNSSSITQHVPSCAQSCTVFGVPVPLALSYNDALDNVLKTIVRCHIGHCSV